MCSVKISRLNERRVILHQVAQFREMKTVGRRFYSPLNEEKGVVPRGQTKVMGFCV